MAIFLIFLKSLYPFCYVLQLRKLLHLLSQGKSSTQLISSYHAVIRIRTEISRIVVVFYTMSIVSFC